MERTEKPLVYLDTHVVIWLVDSATKKLSSNASKIINKSEVVISPIIRLEIEYLYEIKRIKLRSEPIIASLEDSLGLEVSETSFSKIIDTAATLSWTRDLFDRLIVSDALINNAYLVTKDKTIRKNYPLAVW